MFFSIAYMYWRVYKKEKYRFKKIGEKENQEGEQSLDNLAGSSNNNERNKAAAEKPKE
jgi:hypothetical protein